MAIAGTGQGRSAPLARSFYDRSSLEVAPDLLNKVLVAGRCRGRIVEVEAYAGALDPASHAYRGPTARNATMFGPPGHLYVYFTYGMHFCANAVTGRPEDGHAVLLRALAPLAGIETMRSRRPAARRDKDLASGPAKLCQAMGIGRADDGADLVRGRIRIVDDGVRPPAEPGVSVRVGITKAVDRPWRWFVIGEPNVSRCASALGSSVASAGGEPVSQNDGRRDLACLPPRSSSPGLC